MVTNYNEIFIEPRYWEDNYKVGDKFNVDKSNYCSRLRPFIGLEVKSIYYKMGIVCLTFDWDEWKNNTNKSDNDKSVQLSINNIAKFE